jgi:hypothetical protein
LLASQEMLIAIARFMFLFDAQAKLDPLYSDVMDGMVDLHDVLKTSPAE